jgi:hypothetical protein
VGEDVHGVDDLVDALRGIYPRVSTPRPQAGSQLINDVLKCQLKPITPSDHR